MRWAALFSLRAFTMRLAVAGTHELAASDGISSFRIKKTAGEMKDLWRFVICSGQEKEGRRREKE